MPSRIFLASARGSDSVSVWVTSRGALSPRRNTAILPPLSRITKPPSAWGAVVSAIAAAAVRGCGEAAKLPANTQAIRTAPVISTSFFIAKLPFLLFGVSFSFFLRYMQIWLKVIKSEKFTQSFIKLQGGQQIFSITNFFLVIYFLTPKCYNNY